MGTLEGLSAFTDSKGELHPAARTQLNTLVSRAGQVLTKEGIECDFHHGGCVMAAARHTSQIARARETLAHFQGLGFSEDDYRWLTPEALTARMQVANPGGAVFTPHVARVQPAKLVMGLARVVKALGVRVFEHTRATSIGPGASTAIAAVSALTRLLLRRRATPRWATHCIVESFPFRLAWS